MKALLLICMLAGCLDDPQLASDESELSLTTECNPDRGDCDTSKVFTCSNTNPSLHKCDQDFIAWCQNVMHGSYGCTSTDCQQGACRGFP